MRAPTTRQAATPAPTARAAGCMAGLAALVLSLAAWSDLGAGGADTRQSIGERRSWTRSTTWAPIRISNAARRAEADSRLGGSAAPIRLKHKPAWAAPSFPLVDLHADYQWRCFMPTISDGFTVLGAIEEKWLSIGGQSWRVDNPVVPGDRNF